MAAITSPTHEQLTTLARVINDVIRVRRLPAQDAQDFAQYVHVKLLERGYDVFARFSGRSSLATYLTVVVNRLRLDWQRATLGKWRPSAAAVRLGPTAVRLDRLIHRDGLTPGEAIATLEASVADAADALRHIVDRLPRRCGRRTVSDAALESIAGVGSGDPIEERQRAQGRARVSRELCVALRTLPADDRWLIAARYGKGRTVAHVARTLRTDQKSLYRRYERALKALRCRLEAAGISQSSLS